MSNPGIMAYNGFINYCYADAASMFLSAHGIEASSGRLEVLSGIALLGAHRLSEPECEKLYLSLVPDPSRLDKAFSLLGHQVERENAAEPLDVLRRGLEHGPVLVGPMDMGALRYFPYHQHATGADHYLVAYAVDGDVVRVHDPMGYPFATVSVEHFLDGWRGEDLPCPGPPFHLWTQARTGRSVTGGEVFEGAMNWFEEIRTSTPNGAEVIQDYADDLEADRLTPRSQSFMTIFLLPSQARRCLDYAQFFREGGARELAEQKFTQGRLMGESLQAGNKGDWKLVSTLFREYAEIEDALSSRPFV
ncbi:hypothetical protein [Myceligenerans indicum]|uniref:BtrH N-terminal domain-containing protein n=1 Tax=Myceligenerans indicum TaxID=2593663 RepID=A0ABS1LHA8_9MICO|nr:hypothetical protein [Myceligenerans indicum]MBL0885620.1 BtrH N-terminal domain-containing protein [Myceligenerans indicum]